MSLDVMYLYSVWLKLYLVRAEAYGRKGELR